MNILFAKKIVYRAPAPVIISQNERYPGGSCGRISFSSTFRGADTSGNSRYL
jgi:hypothetical protein